MNKLRPYQAEGIRDIYEAWQTDPVLMWVLATGGGKTVTFTEVIRRELAAGKRILLIAHREELILQAWHTLYRNGIISGIIMADYPQKYDIAVQVCSIQTIIKRKELPPADVVIFDEGHHAQRGNSYGQIMKRYQHARFLLVSATPYRLSGEGFQYLHPTKQTQLIVNRTLPQLINEGWLVPIKYLVASIPDLQNVHLKQGDYSEKEAEQAMSMAPLVDSYKEHAAGKQGVCFAININHSIHTVQQYLYNGIPAEHLDGTTPDRERSRILSDFRAGLVKVIVNVGIITEGFDFPEMDFCQLARPTKSLNLYLQMVGRVTRALPGLVDLYDTPDERRRAIAESAKPHGIVLDNAGCWQDHGLPDIEHNWQYYFNGTNKKKQKEAEEEMMEILIFIAEDSNGTRHRFTNPHEIEGMRLIEVTKQARQKIIDYNAVKEFEHLYGIFRNKPKVTRPGIQAIHSFVDHCNTHRILMTDEIWQYLYKRLCTDVWEKRDELTTNRAKYPHSYPEQQFNKAIEEIESKGIPKSLFIRIRNSYEQDNMPEILKHRFSTSNASNITSK